MRITAVEPRHPRVECWSTLGLVRLVDPLLVATDAGVRLEVAPGLWSDGASVPPQLLWVLSDRCTHLRMLALGLAHDAAYRSDAVWVVNADASERSITRPEADDLAEALALWAGATYLDGRKIRYGLGIGGAGSWHQKRLDWTPEGV